MKKLALVLWWKFRHPRWHVCAEKGCLNQAIQCRLLNWGWGKELGQEETYWYCVDHCERQGFCWSCGLFWAGVEAFDFALERGGIRGLCPNCQDEFKTDLGDYDDQEYVYDYDYEDF